MGFFDDLIPAERPAGIFDDLIPADDSSPQGANKQSPRPVETAGPRQAEFPSDAFDDIRQAGTAGSAFAPRQTATGRATDPFRGGEAKVIDQGIGDLGKRAARGATEVAASVPEAAAIAGAGNPNATSLFAAEEVQRAEEQIKLAIQHLADRPNMGEEDRQRIEAVVEAERKKIAAYKPLAKLSDGPLKPAAKDRDLYKVGDKVRQASLDLFGTPDPQFDDRFISKLAEGGGNMAGFVAVTLATGLLGGAGAGSALNTSAQYRRAIQDGATEEQAKATAYIGSVVGASEILPIAGALRLLPSPARTRVTQALGQRLSNAFVTAGEEGLQEAMAEIANNATVKGIYKPDQDVWEGAGESALIGAILGGGMGAVAPSAPRKPLIEQVEEEGRAAVDQIIREVTQSPNDLPTGPVRQRPIPPQVPDAPAQVPARPPEVEDAAPTSLPDVPEGSTSLDTLYPEDQAPAQSAPERPQEPLTGAEAPVAPKEPVRVPTVEDATPEAPSEPDILPVVDEDGKETGQFVRIDRETGAVVPVKPETPKQEKAPEADTQTAPQPDVEAPVGDVAPDLDEAQAKRPVEVLEGDNLAEGDQGADKRGDSSLNRTASWVVRDKATGEAVMETFNRESLSNLNAEKYEAVPIGEHLGSLNKSDGLSDQDAESADAGEATDDTQVEEGKADRRYQASAVPRGHAQARRKAANFVEARVAAREFQGKALTNRDTGIEAVVSRNALDKMLSSKAVNKSESPATHSMAVANVDALFENAVHGWVKDDATGEPSVKGIHRFFSRMNKPDGTASMVKLTVKETVSPKNRNPLYTVEAVEFLDDGASAATWVASALKSDGKELPDILSAEAINNIAREIEKDNKAATPEVAGVEALLPDLRKRLNKVLLRNVRLDFDPDLQEQGAIEIGRDGAMRVLIGNTLDGEATVNHETIHILRAMNLFTKSEWSALESEARRLWMTKHKIAERYGDLSEAQQLEEAIAEAFAGYAGRAPNAGIKGAFAKIKRFFRAMKEALTGQGIRSVEDIFADVDTGKVGQREDDGGGAERKYQRQMMKSPEPDADTLDALSAENASLLGEASADIKADRRAFDAIRVNLQDRMLPLMRAERSIGEVRGREVTKAESPYFAEERFFSKAGRRLDQIDEEFTAPVVDMIAKQNYLGKPITLTDPQGKPRTGADAASLWLWARHAQERNSHIASINEGMPDGGSGMSNSEAKAILDEAENGNHSDLLNRLGEMVDRLVQDNIDLRETSGLLSKDEAEIWRAMYKHYVPLRGFAESDLAEASLDSYGVGRNYNTGGKETKTALGRSSEAFDVLSNLISQAQEVAIRVEKNRVGQAMLKFAQENPAPNLYEVSEAQAKRFMDKRTGMVGTHWVAPTFRPQKNSEMAVKLDGKEFRIDFKDPRLAEAMGNVGADRMNWALQQASKFSRYYSAINTTLSPPFMVVNAFRDMITGQINLGGFGGKDSGALRKAALKSWPKAFLGGYRAMKNNNDSEWAKHFREYEEAGGKVSFWQMEQPEAGHADLSKRIRMDSSRIGKLSKGVRFNNRDNPILGFIERTNLAIDNAIRLSVFVEARKKGWTKEDAASLAKNLTVNFNRRGNWGATMNALFPFANAAIQGTHVMARALKHKEVRRAVYAMVGMGLVLDLLNAAMSDDDEDGELAYDKIAPHVSERNLIIPTGSKTSITIPLPYGFNAFFFAGQQIGKVARGVKKPGEATGDTARAFFTAFSPIADETVSKTLTPTVFDFLNELNQNEDWLGRPIRPENPYGEYGPQSYEFYPGVSAPSRWISDILNRASGGSHLEPGAIDVSPEYLDHTFKFLTGGAGRFVMNTGKVIESAVTGTEMEARDFPIARKLVYSVGDWQDRNRYYEFREVVERALYQQKQSLESGHRMDDDLRGLIKLKPALAKTKKLLKELKIRKNAIYADTRLTAKEREMNLKPIYEEEHAIHLKFNEKFIEIMGRQGE